MIKLIWAGVVSILIAVTCHFFFKVVHGDTIVDLEYTITETKEADSFDPLNADKTQNLPVMRMLYATPLEVSSDNLLDSNVLESFEYIPEKREIRFILKDNVKYSDDSKMTANDIALSIARMAYFRPGFPILKDILGVKEWADARLGIETFPQGILVKDRTIIIKFSRQHSNPLFRFCLELFSIIPQRCIDLPSGSLKCDMPPFSGYYSLQGRQNSKMVFARRDLPFSAAEKVRYEKVTFSYESLRSACSSNIRENEVISGSEVDFIQSNCKQIVAGKQIHWMPSSRFSVLRFNPNHKLFSDKAVRYLFAEKVREILTNSKNELEVERGLFPQLLPGYLKSDLLKQEIKESNIAILKGASITLPKMSSGALKIIYDAMIEAASELKMKIRIFEDPTQDDLLSRFLSGQFSVIVGASGFWAQDPVGDVSMWFTPQLHKTMTFVWNDKNIYSMIENLENETDLSMVKVRMEEFNRYIATESVLAPVAHFKRFFITSEKVSGLNIPHAITSPAPWQVMPIE